MNDNIPASIANFLWEGRFEEFFIINFFYSKTYFTLHNKQSQYYYEQQDFHAAYATLEHKFSHN